MNFFEDRKEKSQWGVAQHWCLPRQLDLGDLKHTIGNKIKLNYIDKNTPGIVLGSSKHNTGTSAVLYFIIFRIINFYCDQLYIFLTNHELAT